jgi:hypothetical protein
MADQTDERILRKIYSEVIAGYSLSVHKQNIVYIKHFNPIDLLEFDFKYQQRYSKLVAGGIPTEKERIELLIRDKMWDDVKENGIKQAREYIEDLYNSKSRQYSPKEIRGLNELIEEAHKKLMELLAERMMLIGETAESMAKRIIDTEQIIASFFTDSSLTKKLFNEEEEELDEEELDSAFEIYQQFGQNTNDLNIRRISVSSDFQSMFHLTDNLYFFYGRAVSQLTNYQIRLARYGTHYKNILYGEISPPNDIKNDPEALDDWNSARTNVNKIIDKNDSEDKSTSLFGVSKQELKYLGIEVEGASNATIKKLAKEGGGEISFDEMRKHGLI